jgi:hypothetical protein
LTESTLFEAGLLGESDCDEFGFSIGGTFCFCIVFGSGIPGVGVLPGLNGWFAFFGSIPGIGVPPFGSEFILTTAALAGMPGVFPETGSGLVVIPGGSGWLVAVVLTALALAFPPVSVADPQARLNPKTAQNKTNKKFFNIKKILAVTKNKNSCAGLNVASPGDGDGVQTGTGRYQTDFGRYICSS